jgi:hypothetical protein
MDLLQKSQALVTIAVFLAACDTGGWKHLLVTRPDGSLLVSVVHPRRNKNRRFVKLFAVSDCRSTK